VPSASILDLYALGTLPRRQVLEGLIEAYKTGLVRNPSLAALIETDLEALRGLDLVRLGEVAARSAAVKAEVVSRDFREGGLRRILNYGHTYGHAVEGWHEYRVSHGQSVAAGMLVATEISRRRGLITAGFARDIAATVLALAPRRFALPRAAEAWPLMSNDKKNRGGRVLFVLLTGPGECVCVEDVTPEELEQALTDVERLWHE
jgi:3-dehydroquinate synthetase